MSWHQYLVRRLCMIVCLSLIVYVAIRGSKKSDLVTSAPHVVSLSSEQPLVSDINPRSACVGGLRYLSCLSRVLPRIS